MPRLAFAATASLTLAACQIASPLETPGSSVPTPPPFTLAASAAPSPATPTPWPLPASGLLDPGARRDYVAPPDAQVSLLVSNPSGQAASLGLDVVPAGDGSPSPGPSPSAGPAAGSPAPVPTDTPTPSEPPIAPFPIDGAGLEGDGSGGFGGLGDPGPSTPDAGTPAPAPTATPQPTGFGTFNFPMHDVPTRRVMQVAATPGAHATFWVNDGDATLAGDRQRKATLRVAAPHVNFWVDDEAATAITDAQLQRLADTFENTILPRLTPVFGSANLPAGVPFDLVISPWIGQAPNRKGMMGYFWPRDVLPVAGAGQDLRQHSNQRHVIFISTALMNQPDVTEFGTLAHEYQHLLMFDAKSRSNNTPHTEETWLDEGFAMLAMDLAGYGAPGGDPFVTTEVSNFRHHAAQYSLTDWTHNPNGYSYGLSYLFTRYLVDRFGTAIVHEIQSTPQTGVNGLEKVLENHGEDFPRVFVEWARATWQSPDGLSSVKLTTSGQPGLRPWGIAPLELDGLDGQARNLAITNAGNPLVVLDREEGGSP